MLLTVIFVDYSLQKMMRKKNEIHCPWYYRLQFAQLVRMEDVCTLLAKNIKAARKRLNLSQEELAARADIDRTYVSGIERKVRNPTITVVARFAAALETTTADLLADHRD